MLEKNCDYAAHASRYCSCGVTLVRHKFRLVMVALLCIAVVSASCLSCAVLLCRLFVASLWSFAVQIDERRVPINQAGLAAVPAHAD